MRLRGRRLLLLLLLLHRWGVLLHRTTAVLRGVRRLRLRYLAVTLLLLLLRRRRLRLLRRRVSDLAQDSGKVWRHGPALALLWLLLEQACDVGGGWGVWTAEGAEQAGDVGLGGRCWIVRWRRSWLTAVCGRNAVAHGALWRDTVAGCWCAVGLLRSANDLSRGNGVEVLVDYRGVSFGSDFAAGLGKHTLVFDVVNTTATIEDLQGYLAGLLVLAGKSDNSLHALEDLSLEDGIFREPLAQDEDINSQAP
jgi:hypothetical protein